MGRIQEAFRGGRKVLVAYLTAGFPRIGQDERLARAALSAGADVLELGFPFSDPIADGPLIQAAAKRAIENGMTLKGTLDLAARLRRGTNAPIVLMGYANPVHSMGYARFAAAAADHGVDGAIVPDLPLEEAAPLLGEMRARGLALVPMAAPTTPPERLARALAAGDGFLYLVSMTGITGDPFAAQAPWRGVAEQARRLGRLPVCVGFGIRTAADAVAAAAASDGVVVGSVLTEAILSAPDDASAEARVGRLVGELASALESGYPSPKDLPPHGGGEGGG